MTRSRSSTATFALGMLLAVSGCKSMHPRLASSCDDVLSSEVDNVSTMNAVVPAYDQDATVSRDNVSQAVPGASDSSNAGQLQTTSYETPVMVDPPLESVWLLDEIGSVAGETMDLGLGSLQVTADLNRSDYLATYFDRVGLYDETSGTDTSMISSPVCVGGTQAGQVECGLDTWWQQDVTTPSRQETIPVTVDVETLIIRALANSKYLRGLADLPLIRQRSIAEAVAEFDVTAFVDSRFNRISDPVGNELTVGPGNPKRFRENDFSTTAGLRRRATTGARMELSQRAGLLNNNSTFLNPRRQGNSRLTLSVTQPLMSGRGKAYNTSLVMLAEMDEKVAWDEVSAQLQDYVVEVTDAYWQLYLERARYEQNQRHLTRAQAILDELIARQDIDAVDSQIARLKAAVRTREAVLLRSGTEVKNVESKLRGLINDPELYGSAIELIPAEPPRCSPMNLSVQDAMAQALQSRSEIDKSIQEVRAAGVRMNVAKNELMPVLDLVLDTYLAGLRGDDNVGNAFTDQFSEGEPGYTAGIMYELPYGNRLAKNRYSRRRIEMRQAVSKFEAQVETLMAEVEIAVREVDTTYQELAMRHEAMTAAETDLAYFQRRWETVPGDDRSAAFLLEDILNAQTRLSSAESNFAQSQKDYAVAILNWKRAQGILLTTERIQTTSVAGEDGGRYQFIKEHVISEYIDFPEIAVESNADVFIPLENVVGSPVDSAQPFETIGDPSIELMSPVVVSPSDSMGTEDDYYSDDEDFLTTEESIDL